MELFIGVILFVIIVIIIGLILRKRLYDTVDYYENWKIDIMGRNVAIELTKVKTLNNAGEAKEKLEQWKKEWDSILTKQLADIEEVLFDAEHAADRFHFSKAKKHFQTLELSFIEIEKKIEHILSETEQLLQTEEETRKEIERIQPQIGNLRNYLVENRTKFERALHNYNKQLDDLEDDINIYNELTEAGTYSEAAEVVKNIQTKLQKIEDEVEQFPEVYHTCKFALPEQLDQLFKGTKEMESEGYPLEHLNLMKKINDYQARLLDFVRVLEAEGIEKVKALIPDVEESIQEMYDALEEEVLARNFVEAKAASFTEFLDKQVETFLETRNEIELLKEAYQFENEALEQFLTLDKQLKELTLSGNNFTKNYEKNEQPFSVLRDELEGNLNKLATFEAEHDEFLTRLANLRKDELEAREQIDWMMEEMNKIKRKLRHSNLPGIPSYIVTLLESSVEKNNKVLESLEQQPLDIISIQKTLQEAKSSVENALEQTNNMLDQAALTERIIQYANRYRSRNPMLAAKLLEAEQQFRKGEYELALEQAAEAVEEVEPGALKKIEQIHAHFVTT